MYTEIEKRDTISPPHPFSAGDSMKAELNQRMTQVGPGTPGGELLRRYWQPVALMDEFNPALDPQMAVRPVKAVRVLGQNFVLFRDAQGTFGLLDRDCPHRGADLAFGRNEGDGLRCPFHGWKFDTTGQCIETPAEPAGSKMCTRIKQRSYPLVQRSGVLFGWFGPEDQTPPPFPELDCFTAPESHTFAFKGLWHCNWLQSLEVGIDPAHASYLHRFFNDGSLEDSYGKQFRGASAGDVGGERWPMTRVMREFGQPHISFEAKPYGLQLTALRPMTDELTHVRVTNAVFPQTFVIPLSETMTITQMHVPVDDTHNYWYAFFTSFTGPVDKDAMRTPRLQAVTLPDYIPKSGRHNNWGFNAEEQQNRTYLGMGEDDINVHDQWACESMGPIQDRTREHLGTTDKVVMANRRMLLQAIDAVEQGGTAPGVADPALHGAIAGPDTVDGIAPAQGWETWWQDAVRDKREGAPWHQKASAEETAGAK
jgi:phthalate 4,5-dioxygenase oxygenase subunit